MSKKTVSVELRLSPELKELVAQRSATRETTMSGYLRDLVIEEAEGRSNLNGETKMKHYTTHAARMGLATLPVAAAAALYLLVGQAPAVANTDARLAFAELDRNGDGVVSKAEYDAMMLFTGAEDAPESALPADAELPEACAGLDLDEEAFQEPSFTSYDANKDGTVSLSELTAAYDRELIEDFTAMDRNDDGFITVEEMSLVSLSFAADGKDMEACFAALDEKAGAQDDVLAQADAAALVEELDRDGDGRISLREMMAD